MSGNINNYEFNRLELKLSNSDYWDFTLAKNRLVEQSNIITTGDCFVSYFDFNNSNIFSTGSTNIISSLIYWTGATNTGYTLNTIGLTGIDNGLIPYVKNSADTSNLGLLSALTGSTLIIPSNDKRLHLHMVSGSTEQYNYDINIASDHSGNYANFCGGFYQGYYKIDGTTYEVLPVRTHQGWVAEFWLKRDISCTGNTGTTLNNTYPNNSGFFFYIGSRAENKFWNKFDGMDTGCTSGCTVESGCTEIPSYWCTVPKETDIFIGLSGSTVSLYPDQTTTELITNQFLIYGRAGSGGTKCNTCGSYNDGLAQKLACNYDGNGILIKRPKTTTTNYENPFLIYGRAGSGSTKCGSCGEQTGYGNQTVCSFSGFQKSIEFENKDNKLDIIDNALGFRIKDDGSIGYRLFTATGSCSGNTYISGTTILENYSEPDLIPTSGWTSVIIRYTTEYYDDCDLLTKQNRKGRLMFYINGKLKYYVDDFNELIVKRLDDDYRKQIGVPYNISLGGGSQGLLESQTFDGRDQADLNLTIQNNFAGTFIGGISQFKFNICDLYFNDIQNIYRNEVERYKLP